MFHYPLPSKEKSKKKGKRRLVDRILRDIKEWEKDEWNTGKGLWTEQYKSNPIKITVKYGDIEKKCTIQVIIQRLYSRSEKQDLEKGIYDVFIYLTDFFKRLGISSNFTENEMIELFKKAKSYVEQRESN